MNDMKKDMKEDLNEVKSKIKDMKNIITSQSNDVHCKMYNQGKILTYIKNFIKVIKNIS